MMYNYSQNKNYGDDIVKLPNNFKKKWRGTPFPAPNCAQFSIWSELKEIKSIK
jgi:hypothetical protein